MKAWYFTPEPDSALIEHCAGLNIEHLVHSPPKEHYNRRITASGRIDFRRLVADLKKRMDIAEVINGGAYDGPVSCDVEQWKRAETYKPRNPLTPSQEWNQRKNVIPHMKQQFKNPCGWWGIPKMPSDQPSFAGDADPNADMDYINSQVDIGVPAAFFKAGRSHEESVEKAVERVDFCHQFYIETYSWMQPYIRNGGGLSSEYDVNNMLDELQEAGGEHVVLRLKGASQTVAFEFCNWVAAAIS